MLNRNKFQIGATAQGVVKMHCPAARQHEDVTHALISDEAHYVVRKFCCLSHLVTGLQLLNLAVH